MNTQNKEKLQATVQLHREQVRALGVRRLGLFGSFVRGEQRADSDVDVLVEFEADHKTFDNFMQLASLLERLFGREVEMVTPESLSPYIRPHILREVEYVPLAG